MNNVRQIQALNKRELENCVSPSASWHTDYRDTAYIYVGGLSFDLTEGDIITIFSQFGEPVWLKLARDKETGKSKGFAWLKYEDQRSTDLAVDNLGGATILGRIIRVDHARYKKREEDVDEDEFNVAFQHQSSDERGHGQSRHLQRKDRSGEPPRKKPKDNRDMTKDSDDEDPMKDYLSNEKHETHELRRRRNERHHQDHRDNYWGSRRHRD